MMAVTQFALPGLDPGTHVFAGKCFDLENKTWMAGSSPAKGRHRDA
jgi:hypothetical protein